MREPLDTLVVGAGISGLAYAHHRLERDPDSDLVVVDASARAGGLIETIAVDEPAGVRFEAGPETISDPAGVARALCEELGLERVVAPVTRRYLVSRGAVVALPTSPRALLSSPLLPFGARLRLLTEPLRRRGVALDGSIADFVRHRLGQRVLDTLVEPMLAGIHAGDPEQLSLRACFPALVQGMREHGTLLAWARSLRGETDVADRTPWKPAGGMSALPNALARALGRRLRLGTPVTGLERSPGADGWRVTLGGAERLAARRVVLALPLRATQRLLERVAPEASRLLASQGAEGLIVVPHLWPRDRVAHALDGFGYLVPAKERLSHLGTLFASSLDPSSAPANVVVLRTLLGGARDRSALEASDAELLATVRREVGPLLGLRGSPLLASVHRHPAALPTFDLDHPGRLARLADVLPDGIVLLGNHQRGIGLSSLLEEARRASGPGS